MGGSLDDVLPPDTTYASGPDCNVGACEYVTADRAIQWTGDIPADAALTLVFTVTVNSGVSDGALVTNTATLTVGNLSDRTNAVTTTLVVTEPTCIEVESVALTLVSAEPIRVGSPAEFEVDISPDNAAKPYTYTLDIDGTTGAPQTSSTNPLTFSQTLTTSDTHTVKIAVWNCAMPQGSAKTDSVEVKVEAGPPIAYLPIVLKNR